MLVKDYKKFVNLSRLLNSSFGSSGMNHSRFGTHSLKYELLDDGFLKVLCITTVSFPSETMMRESRARYEREGMAIIEAALKDLIERYKAEFNQDISCKILEESFNDSFEFLNYSLYNPMKRALYRVGVFVEID